MKEIIGSLWTLPAEFRVITTNGFIKSDGSAVMGRGTAVQAARKWPVFPKLLGKRIRDHGNRVHLFKFGPSNIITFPVKHNWWEQADLELIAQSTLQLHRFAKKKSACTILMPRAGCGNGRLDWKDVRPILARLPDNVCVVTEK